jgi:hypothetical protein
MPACMPRDTSISVSIMAGVNTLEMKMETGFVKCM